MTEEYKNLYEYTQTVVEKYKDSTKEQQYNNVTDEEAIAMIFWNYLNDAHDVKYRAMNLILGMFGYIQLLIQSLGNNVDQYLKYEEERSKRETKIFAFINILLQNDPRLYTQLNYAFKELKEKKTFSNELLDFFNGMIDKMQAKINENNYKTPFYDATKGKYDGPYLTFNFSDSAIKQKIETQVFPKVQQVLKEKYGDQVEAELKSNGQVWLKKQSDVELGAGEMWTIVNEITMKI